MPIFEYQCTSCERIKEVVRSWTDRDMEAFCDTCGGTVRRAFPSGLSRPPRHFERQYQVNRRPAAPAGQPNVIISNCRWEADVGIKSENGHVRMRNVELKCGHEAIISNNSTFDMENVSIE